MNSILKRFKGLTKLSVLAVFITFSGFAQAHLVDIGWIDNLNGTVTLWGNHWHGAQVTPSTANGGLHISGGGPAFTAQWTGVHNNQSATSLVMAGLIDAHAGDGSTGHSDPNADDWFFTDPLVIGNGTWSFFTGTNCCIDTMANAVSITLTGITSVPPGTGPGGSVPGPSSLSILGIGLAGFLAFSRKKKAQLAA